MAKKQEQYADAERLYIKEMMTLELISERTGVSTRTLQEWKKEGNWEERRKLYTERATTINEDMYNIVRLLLKTIGADLESGKELQPTQLYAATKFIDCLQKAKLYEDSKTATEAEKLAANQVKPEVTAEQVVAIVRQVLGIAA